MAGNYDQLHMPHKFDFFQSDCMFQFRNSAQMTDLDAWRLFQAALVSALLQTEGKSSRLDTGQFLEVMDRLLHNRCLRHKAEEWTEVQTPTPWCSRQWCNMYQHHKDLDGETRWHLHCLFVFLQSTNTQEDTALTKWAYQVHRRQNLQGIVRDLIVRNRDTFGL
jgi:hypothetical protein